MPDPHPSVPHDLDAALSAVPTEERPELAQIWDDLGSIPAPDTDAAWHALQPRLRPPEPASRRASDRAARRPARSVRARAIAWSAAGAALAGLVALGVWWSAPVVHRAAEGATVAVVLPDGSRVVVGSGAELRHERRFGATRAVALAGEAFFDVEPSDAPFVVTTHNAEVEVLGTQFNVRAWDGETAVAVLEGSVRVARAGGAAGARVLAAGDAATVQADGVEAREADVAREAGWRSGSLAFDGRPLAAVLAEVERRYAVSLTGPLGAASGRRVSAYYATPPDLAELLGDLGSVAGVRFVRTSEGYRVEVPAAPSAPALPQAQP